MEVRREDIVNVPAIHELQYKLFDEELNGDISLFYNPDTMNFDNFINQKLSGIGYYRTEFNALSEYNKNNDFLRYYYQDISRNLNNLNNMISDLTIGNMIKRSLLNTILDIISLIEYEFEWIPKEVIDNIKKETIKCEKSILYCIIDFDINSIYYVALSILGKTEYQITEEDDNEFIRCITLAAGPMITLCSSKAVVFISNAIYEALFNSLYGQFNQQDFDLIANKIGEILVLFRNDIDKAINMCIVEECAHRLNSTPLVLNSTKQLCEELGIPFNYDITGYLKY